MLIIETVDIVTMLCTAECHIKHVCQCLELVVFWWTQAVQRPRSCWRCLMAGRNHNSPRNAIHMDFSRKVVSRFCFQLTVRSTYVTVGHWSLTAWLNWSVSYLSMCPLSVCLHVTRVKCLDPFMKF